MKALTNNLWILLGIAMSAAPAMSRAPGDLAHLQNDWAVATYEMEASQRVQALEQVAEDARAVASENPNDVELLIWKGIIISSLAGERGGLGALGLAKEARATLEEAMAIDPDALQGSAYATLGTLYHKVPGWPIGFGSDRKARELLAQAVAINPNGIDSNYFMGQFLADEGDIEGARRYLLAAQAAQDRPDRPLADRGRRQEIAELLGSL
jgi:tetratricopeptide (TPR) repeat protein